MKKTFILYTIGSVTLLSSCSNPSSNQTIVNSSNSIRTELDQPKETSGFAVTELFTSEGCSSCPAADRAVEILARKKPDDAYVVAFHVDYWNNLGWVDSFSKAEYTQRQSKYARQFQLSSIYTPQVVVNGSEEFVGSNGSRLASVTTTELNNSGAAKIELSIKSQDVNSITVSYKTAVTKSEKLQIALVQNEALTSVKRDEKGGRQLHHINPVREFQTLSSGEGETSFTLPAHLKAAGVSIIAYLENASGKVKGAKKLRLG